jgi:hypothetical protein
MKARFQERSAEGVHRGGVKACETRRKKKKGIRTRTPDDDV